MSIGPWLGWFVPLALVVGFTWWWRADLFRTSVRTNAQKDVAEIVKNYAQAAECHSLSVIEVSAPLGHFDV